MSLDYMSMLLRRNDELSKKGQLYSYGAITPQTGGVFTDLLNNQKQIDQSQQTGMGDSVGNFFGSLLAETVSPFNFAIDRGTDAAKYLARLATGRSEKEIDATFKAFSAGQRLAGGSSAQNLESAEKYGRSLVTDPTSTSAVLGGFGGALAGMLIPGTAAARGLKLASKAAPALSGLGRAVNMGRLGQTSVAEMLGLGAASALQAADVNWDQFSKEDGDPDKMTGAEYLTRVVAAGTIGGATAGFNPAYGWFKNVVIDASTNAAGSALSDLAAMAAANDKRRQEIGSQLTSNAMMQGAVGAVAGAGFRGAGKLVDRIMYGKPSEVASSAYAPPTEQASQALVPKIELSQPSGYKAPVIDVAAGQGIDITPEEVLRSPQQIAEAHYVATRKMAAYLEQLPPETVSSIAAKLNALEASPAGIVNKLQTDAAQYDPAQTGAGLQWMEGVFNSIVPKPTVARPVEAVAPAAEILTPVTVEAPVQPELPVTPAAVEAPVVPPVGNTPIEPPAPTAPATQEPVAPPAMSPAERLKQDQALKKMGDNFISNPTALSPGDKFPSMKVSGRGKGVNQVSIVESNAISPTEHEIVYTTNDDPTLQTRYYKLNENTGRWSPSKRPAPTEAQPIIEGEQNVQPRLEDVNVSEPGQPEPIAGEQLIPPSEPAKPVAEEVPAPVRAEGEVAPQVQEVTTPITEPIAGEPNATQEGQVTEGGQPEYLGVPQGEDVQENVTEVRQEEGGRPGDSGGLVEGGQEQPGLEFAGEKKTKRGLIDDMRAAAERGDTTEADRIRDQILQEYPVKPESSELAANEQRTKTALKSRINAMVESPNTGSRQRRALSKKIGDNLDVIYSDAKQALDSGGDIKSVLKDYGIKGDAAESMSAMIESSILSEKMLPIVDKILSKLEEFDREVQDRTKKGAKVKNARSEAIRTFLDGDSIELPLNRIGAKDQSGGATVLDALYGPSMPSMAALKRQLSDNRRIEINTPAAGRVGILQLLPPKAGSKVDRILITTSPELLSAIRVAQSIESVPAAISSEVLGPIELDIASAMAEDIQRGVADRLTGATPEAGIGAEELMAAKPGGAALRQGDIAAQESRYKYALSKETASEQIVQAVNTVRDEYGAEYNIENPNVQSSIERELYALGVKNPAKAAKEAIRAERAKAITDSAEQVMDETVRQTPEGVTMRKRRRGGTSPMSGTQLQSSIGIIPYVASQFLDDDTEYLPGMDGKTIKRIALAIGAASMLHSISRKPIISLGNKSVPDASPRFPLIALSKSIKEKGIYGTIRESRASYKDRVALIKDTVYQEARIRRMSQEEIDAKIQRAIEDDRKLDGMPFIEGMSSAASLDILSRSGGHEYPQLMQRAVASGRVAAGTLAMPMRAARDLFSSFSPDIQGKIGELAYVIDRDTTDIINKNIHLGYDAVVKPKIDEYLSTVRDRLGKEDAALLKAYDEILPIMDDVRDNHYESIAYEQTGMNISDGLKYYNKQTADLQTSMSELSEKINKMDAEGYNQGAQADALSVLHGMQNAYGVALRYRSLFAELRLAKQLSKDRQYMPRWFGGDDAIHKLRVRQSATDPGTVMPFRTAGELAIALDDFNAEASLEELGLSSRTLDDGTYIRSKADLYRAQGGEISSIEGKGNQSKILEANIDPMVLRDAIEAISDNAVNGEIPADRFKIFYDLYGNDISKLVDAATLQRLGLSSKMDKSIPGKQQGVTLSDMRQLINAIAVPRVVDSTMHRTNVLGYAPYKVDPVTKDENPQYSQQIANWFMGAIDHMERQVRSKAEDGAIRREGNRQIADLVSRNIAPRYTRAIAHIVSGLRWNPNFTETVISDPITNALIKADKGIALVGAFRMMGGNVVSAPKNVGLGYVTLMPEMVSETGGVRKAANAVKRAEQAYWANMIQDRNATPNHYEYLKTYDSIASSESKIMDAIDDNAMVRAAWRWAQNTGSFDASFYKSVERSVGGTFSEGGLASKVFDKSMLPSVMAENHNRGVSYMAGVLAWLDKYPSDLNGAIKNGIRIQDISQGNFSGHAKTGIERAIINAPFGRSFLLLKSAAIRTFEMTSAHMLVAANRPTARTVFAPLLGMLGASIIFGGLQGAPVTGDMYNALDAFYTAAVKDDDALSLVKENFYDYVRSEVVKMGARAGLDSKQSRYIYDVLASGYISALTGKNFALDNNATSLLTGDVPGFSTFKDVKAYIDAFGGKLDPVATARLLNVQAGRFVKSVTQLAEGGKYGKGGYVVDDIYTPWQAVGDFFLGSDKKEAMYGMNKVDDGGTIFFPDQAQAYLDRLKSLGLKIDPSLHYAPFQAAEKGRAVMQTQPEAVNALRNRIILNYEDMSDARENALRRWEQIKKIPGIEQKLIFIAMKGQRGSRLSQQVQREMRDADNRIKQYYLAHAVQMAYQQMGLPVPAYRHAGKDPLAPLIEHLDKSYNQIGATPVPEDLPEEQYIEEE